MSEINNICDVCGHPNDPSFRLCEMCSQPFEQTVPFQAPLEPGLGPSTVQIRVPAPGEFGAPDGFTAPDEFAASDDFGALAAQAPPIEPTHAGPPPPPVSVQTFPDTPPQEGAEGNDPLIGQTIGNFVVIHKIASGGFGAVYYARHTLLEQVYAIKVLHMHQQQPDMVERFKQEAKILAQMSHPYVVRMIDFGTLPSVGLYMVMEFLEGRTLYNCILKGEHFPLPRIRALCIEICEVLSYICGKGVVHRDLKPGNIYMTFDEKGEEHIKLIDFGIASLLYSEKELTQAGSFIGTAKYGSPEQIRGNKQLDVRSDLYSLGVILYRLLTGREPFLVQGKSIYSVIFQHLNSPPPSLSEVAPQCPWSPDLDTFFQQALAKKPEERFPTPEQFLDAFQRGLDAQELLLYNRNDTVATQNQAGLQLPPHLEKMRDNPAQFKEALQELHDKRQKKLGDWVLRGVDMLKPDESTRPIPQAALAAIPTDQDDPSATFGMPQQQKTPSATFGVPQQQDDPSATFGLVAQQDDPSATFQPLPQPVQLPPAPQRTHSSTNLPQPPPSAPQVPSEAPPRPAASFDAWEQQTRTVLKSQAEQSQSASKPRPQAALPPSQIRRAPRKSPASNQQQDLLLALQDKRYLLVGIVGLSALFAGSILWLLINRL